MQGAINLQQCLFVGSGDFVANFHRKAPTKRVYLAQNVTHWDQHGHTQKDAEQKATLWGIEEAPDCYATVNGFGWVKGTGRTLSAVESINGFYIDFDCYNIPGLSHLSPGDLLDKILAENPWLPEPTMFVDSGNGCWAFWLFDRPLLVNNPKTRQFDFLSQWQTFQHYLVQKLLPYGADPKCADAARVVRIAGTLNTKTNRAAQAWTTGQRYSFHELKKAINVEFLRENPRQQCLPIDRPQKPASTDYRGSAKVSRLLNLYSLADARMRDLRKLAHLRGGRLTDHRRMAIWVYTVAAAQFCKFEDTLRGEAEAFINAYISEPEKYLKSVNFESTVQRFRNEQELILAGVPRHQIRDQLGRDKAAYILTNRYIISQLEITEAEQRHLKTIIGKVEHQRRNTAGKSQKRRASGVESRADYLARSLQRRQQAVQLRSEGLSVRVIAEQMGLSVGAVHRYLAA